MTNELQLLLSLDIPSATPNPDGFLEIAGIAHYENVNSRIYAHFLNSEHEGVRSSFVNALLQLVNEKSGKDISLHAFTAHLEEVTNKNYRIDLLLIDSGNKTALIIENKIYHHLDNDLENYWNHIPFEEKNKVGVLLTLYPHDIPEEVTGKFINITHSEWIGCVRNNGLPMGIPPNYYIYINDFATTIDRLTKSYAMNEQTRFYFQHAQKILAAKHTMDEAYHFIEDQLDILCARLGWQKYGSSWEWRNIWDKENTINTFFTIWYEPILKGELKFSIFLELMGKDKERMTELEPILANSEQYQAMEHNTYAAKHYIHFGVRNYTLTMEQLDHFGEHMYDLILRDFAVTIVTIIKYYYPDKNIDAWLPNFEKETSLIN
jgi:hypothetical protein